MCTTKLWHGKRRISIGWDDHSPRPAAAADDGAGLTTVRGRERPGVPAAILEQRRNRMAIREFYSEDPALGVYAGYPYGEGGEEYFKTTLDRPIIRVCRWDESPENGKGKVSFQLLILGQYEPSPELAIDLTPEDAAQIGAALVALTSPRAVAAEA
jgi:hypothetical protein